MPERPRARIYLVIDRDTLELAFVERPWRVLRSCKHTRMQLSGAPKCQFLNSKEQCEQIYWTSNPTWQTCEQIDLKETQHGRCGAGSLEVQHHAATILKVPKQMSSAAGSMRATKCIQPNRTTKSCTLHRDSTPSTHIRDNVHPKSCLHAKCYLPVACTTFDTITNGQEAVRTPAAYNAALTGRIHFFVLLWRHRTLNWTLVAWLSREMRRRIIAPIEIEVT